ncbi:hypothetical protein OS493_009885 [Desmophyllum pertusum]|uniref:Uncharacterized protein n=1 Tax=Desmophyllum pertusum TaxID=174260 RepID=A0A9W9YE53_9CNID|nr:hypothetical protein OS493_009885 [Desmophyllum pertusum]
MTTGQDSDDDVLPVLSKTADSGATINVLDEAETTTGYPTIPKLKTSNIRIYAVTSPANHYMSSENSAQPSNPSRKSSKNKLYVVKGSGGRTSSAGKRSQARSSTSSQIVQQVKEDQTTDARSAESDIRSIVSYFNGLGKLQDYQIKLHIRRIHTASRAATQKSPVPCAQAAGRTAQTGRRVRRHRTKSRVLPHGCHP